MTQTRLVTLRLSTDLINAIEIEAHRHEITAAQVIRAALSEVLIRRAAPPASSNYSPRPSLIAATFDAAQDWLDLQRRLRAEGLVLRLAEGDRVSGTRIALHDWPGDRFLIWLDDAGQSFAELSLRFRAPFPGALRRHAAAFPPGTFRALHERAAELSVAASVSEDKGRAA